MRIVLTTLVFLPFSLFVSASSILPLLKRVPLLVDPFRVQAYFPTLRLQRLGLAPELGNAIVKSSLLLTAH
jgi:hypothetical protein